jgi:hypothetical protein
MMAKRIIAICAFAVASLVTLGAVLFVIEDLRGRAAWRKYQTEATARGIRLRLPAYLVESPPPENNFAAVPLFTDLFANDAEKKAKAQQAFALPEGERPEASDAALGQRANLAEWASFLATKKGDPQDESKPPADRLLAALEERYADEDAELRLAAARPACRFPVKWEDGLGALLPHLSILVHASRINGLRLEAHAAQGKREEMLADFRLGMRLVHALDKEPVLLDGIVRVAMVRALANSVWSSLATETWDEGGLREVAESMGQLRLLEDWKFSIESERAAMNVVMEQLVATNRSERTRLLRMASPSEGGPLVWSVFPRGWLLQNMVRMNQYVDEVAAQIPVDEQRFRPGATPHALAEPPHSAWERIYYRISALLLPAFERVQTKFLETHTAVQQLRTACDLARFRLKHGGFPESLAQLAAEFSTEAPRDIIDGAPLRYRRTGAESYVLYSIAQNGKDDGGAVGKKGEQDRLDWVWRFPGTTAVQVKR